GTFQPAVSYRVGQEPAAVVVGDFNGDGNPDVATANQGARSVSVLLGRGDGTFLRAVSYRVGRGSHPGPSSLAVSAFHAAGRPDVATANGASAEPDVADNTVSVLLGRGDGTFWPAVSVGANRRPITVIAGDFNNDGAPDLVVANDNRTGHEGRNDLPRGYL